MDDGAGELGAPEEGMHTVMSIVRRSGRPRTIFFGAGSVSAVNCK